MIRETAAGVNAPATPPPVPLWFRWPCPTCGAMYRHPWYLAEHLARPAARLGHGLAELDAWTLAATVAPVDTTPGTNRRPPMPHVPVAAPPLALVR